MFLKVLLILLAGAAVALYEVPRLLKRQMHREFFAFCVLFFIGVGLTVALALDLPLPNPTSVVEFVFGPLSRMIYSR
ncbi:hypothetical protein Tph_c08530 [Thermacetogenium phaeum DSM 12270]|jgi:hypothetical protein|uniref:Uncharacterized protein n=1 Tax=Thermacetogenium phaeum (strain ATCC BAA-254 / DSM 26808 / PB) TaxID=1089553 RepID=K4LDZ4_THEPS|nr:hypothetical protein [Thermacetogenium phaeum]AFV11083.1 hypothetical protein Tph_c08530 [Thermacetogenium phaeum DSM 12270]MDK2880606.1 hypothetical protein [Clostridia bacterium]MDN5365514.1 hypothetical protein [Thermacetogenium sp.]